MNLLTAIALAILIMSFVEVAAGIVSVILWAFVLALRLLVENVVWLPERMHLFHARR